MRTLTFLLTFLGDMFHILSGFADIPFPFPSFPELRPIRGTGKASSPSECQRGAPSGCATVAKPKPQDLLRLLDISFFTIYIYMISYDTLYFDILIYFAYVHTQYR